MNKTLHFLIMLFCLIVVTDDLTAEIDKSQNWQAITLNVKENQSLGSLFDDGFRPYRFPALETTTLEQKYIRLLPRFSSTLKGSEFPAEYVTLIVDKPWVINRLEAVTPWLSEEDAYMKIRFWVKEMGLAGSEDKVKIYFEKLKTFQTLSELRDDYDQDFTVDIISGDKYHAKLVLRARPRKRLIDQKPVRVKMIITWSPYKKSAARKIYKEPIPPPSGYENFSMIAPADFGPGVSNLKKKIKKPVFDRLKNEPSIVRKAGSKRALKKTPSKSEKKLSGLSWKISGVLLIGIFILLFKIFKSKFMT